MVHFNVYMNLIKEKGKDNKLAYNLQVTINLYIYHVYIYSITIRYENLPDWSD